MQLAELAKLAEGLATLCGQRKGDCAMRCPFVRSDGLRFRVLAEEGELFEMILLERVRYETMTI